MPQTLSAPGHARKPLTPAGWNRLNINAPVAGILERMCAGQEVGRDILFAAGNEVPSFKAEDSKLPEDIANGPWREALVWSWLGNGPANTCSLMLLVPVDGNPDAGLTVCSKGAVGEGTAGIILRHFAEGLIRQTFIRAR